MYFRGGWGGMFVCGIFMCSLGGVGGMFVCGIFMCHFIHMGYLYLGEGGGNYFSYF